MFFKKYPKLTTSILCLFSSVFAILLCEIILLTFTPYGNKSPLKQVVRPIEMFLRKNVARQKELFTLEPLDNVFVGKRYNKNKTVIRDKGEFVLKYQLNSNGYRDYEENKNFKNEFCITSLGDSFTVGAGVGFDESYPSLLEKRLNCRVHKLSVWAHSNIEAFLHLQKLDHKTDLVILGLWESKMIYRDQQFLVKYFDKIKKQIKDTEKLFQLAQLSSVEYRKAYSPHTERAKRYLTNNSALYGFVADKIRRISFISDLLMRIGLAKTSYTTDITEDDHPYPLKKMRYGTYIHPTMFRPSMGNSYFQLTFEIIKQMNEYLKKRNTELLVLLIPSLEQVYWPVFLNLNPKMKEFYKPELSNKLIVDFLKQQKIHCLNMLPLLRSHVNLSMDVWDNNEELYYGIDPHWTAKGHKITYEALYDYLILNKLIPVN